MVWFYTIVTFVSNEDGFGTSKTCLIKSTKNYPISQNYDIYYVAMLSKDKA